MNEHSRTKKILERIGELSLCSEDRHAITRTFGSDAFREAVKKVQSWMNDAGLQTRVDNIGNVRGRRNCGESGAKTLVIASHIDTVINAGRFDGPLGVIMGLDMVEQVIEKNSSLPFNIELIAFCDEEGVRFHTTYLGSKVVAGCFDQELLQSPDTKGRTVQDVIEEMGGDAGRLKADAIPVEDWLGYFEIHIEQGPVLYEKNIPVALVSDIAGQSRVEIHFKGEAGHAGTVSMDKRRDALCCACECILQTEKMALDSNGKLTATIGKINLENAASNVIPGIAVCSLDLRSSDASFLEISHRNLQAVFEAVCIKRNIVIEWKRVQESKPVSCNEVMNQCLASAIYDAGYEIISLVSGAGHDAVAISAVAPVCMLFVRCYKGISHHPLENVEAGDIEAAIHVADGFIDHLKNTKKT
ncbi:MAG: M20 family metallo-hydrolase [Chitinophagaceae bacterium]